MSKTYELIPVDGRKSFYHKAVVYTDDSGIDVLYSYGTPVAEIYEGELIKLWDGYSATTSRHIHSFCLSHGIKGVSKKEWEEMKTYRVQGLYRRRHAPSLPSYRATYY